MDIGTSSNTADPRVVAGLRAQAERRRALVEAGATRVGWKAGFGTAAAMQKLSTATPLVGFLTSRSQVASGATVSIEGWTSPVLEHEVALRMAADLAPGASREDARRAIGAVAPAIELVDIGAADDVEAILGGNIFHRFVVLGDFVSLGSDAPLDEIRVTATENGSVRVSDADPTEVLGDLLDIVRALADQLPLADDAVRARDVLITGAAISPTALTGAEHVEVRIADHGSVSVRIEG